MTPHGVRVFRGRVQEDGTADRFPVIHGLQSVDHAVIHVFTQIVAAGLVGEGLASDGKKNYSGGTKELNADKTRLFGRQLVETRQGRETLTAQARGDRHGKGVETRQGRGDMTRAWRHDKGGDRESSTLTAQTCRTTWNMIRADLSMRSTRLGRSPGCKCRCCGTIFHS